MNTEQTEQEYTDEQLEGIRTVDRVLRRLTREKAEIKQQEAVNASA